MIFAAEPWLTGDRLGNRERHTEQQTWGDSDLPTTMNVVQWDVGPQRMQYLGAGKDPVVSCLYWKVFAITDNNNIKLKYVEEFSYSEVLNMSDEIYVIV